MIKKIRVTNNKARPALRDTPNGSVYCVSHHYNGHDESILFFTDDANDSVDIFEDGRGYIVVEEV